MAEGLMLSILFAVAFLTTYISILKLKKLALKNNITAPDLNKKGNPRVFHIAGIGITTGFFVGAMLAVALTMFSLDGLNLNINKSLAIALTALALSFLGLVDDIFSIPQWVKALLPMIAAIPLIALRAAGSTIVYVPILGNIDFGIFYLLVIIPFAISGSANLANIFAGINGLEALLSLIMYSTALILGLYFEKPHLTVFSSIMLGSLLAFYIFNKYPSRVFPGDVGTLIMGGTISALAIVDNLESFVPILFLPHLLDLIIKIKNRLPSKGWWFEEKEGYLTLSRKPVSLLQHTVKFIGKIKEKELVYLYAAIEVVLAIISIGILIKL